MILEKEGHFVKKVPIDTDVAPLSKAEYPMPFALPEEPGEYAVTVSFTLKEDTKWAKAGHEVAFGQEIFRKKGEECKKKNPSVEVIYGKLNLGVRGENFDVLFSGLNGGLVSYRYAGKEMIEAIPNAELLACADRQRLWKSDAAALRTVETCQYVPDT